MPRLTKSTPTVPLHRPRGASPWSSSTSLSALLWHASTSPSAPALARFLTMDKGAGRSALRLGAHP